MSERALAADLERALAGAPAGDEARELAALLVAAAEPCAFAVESAEVEAPLAGAEPARPRRRVGRLQRVAVAAAVVAAVAVAALFFPHAPGQGVQARAAVAASATYFVDADVVPARPG